MKRTLWISAGLGLLGLLASALVWAQVPDPMPIHWDQYGMANGFAPRFVGLLMMPLFAFLVPAFVAAISRRKIAGEANRKALSTVMLAIGAFTLGMHALVIQAALAADQGISLGGVFALLGALFAVLGHLMTSLTPNRVMGVRTRATLGNEAIWKLTHRFARWTMIAAGLFCIVAPLFVGAPTLVWLCLGAIFLGSLLPVAYAHVLAKAKS